MTKRSFDIPKDTIKVPLFKLGNPTASLSDNSSSDGIGQEIKISSLEELLLNPDLLGELKECVLKIKKISTGERCVVQLSHSQMLFNDMDCQILTIRDISAQQNLEIAEEKNNLLHLLTSSVSHE